VLAMFDLDLGEETVKGEFQRAGCVSLRIVVNGLIIFL
jgi:hypothetical protein